jgi:8-oxo-dGTP diphosphatase
MVNPNNSLAPEKSWLVAVDWNVHQAEVAALADRQNGVGLFVGGLIVHPNGSIFAQQRSMTRKLFPGHWDVVGGHVENDDPDLASALAREVTEETGWHLDKIIGCFAYRDDFVKNQSVREYIFLIRVDGDLDHPVLEPGKVDQYAWITPDQTSLLNEHRSGSRMREQQDIYNLAFAYLAQHPNPLRGSHAP